MRGKVMTLKAYFDVSGQERRKRHACSFSVDMSCPAPVLTLHAGDRVVVDPSQAELRRTRPRAVTGTVSGRNAPGATVQFIRQGLTTGLNTTAVVAETTAGPGGGYAVFVPPGDYDLRVYTGSTVTTQRGVSVTSGLRQPWWVTVDGLPQTHVVDQVTFADSEYVLVSGAVEAGDGHLVDQARVLVTAGREVFAYAVTDEAGRYTFALPRGVYDVRFMAADAPTKVAAGVVVDGVNPWIDQLQARGILVSRQQQMSVDPVRKVDVNHVKSFTVRG